MWLILLLEQAFVKAHEREAQSFWFLEPLLPSSANTWHPPPSHWSAIVSRLERWSIFCGDGMVMVIFSQRWNGDGFWKFLTITINGFWWDQPSATMVFRWFCNFWEPMVNNGHWRKNAYFATNSNSQQIAGKLKNYKKSNTTWLQNTLLPIHTADILSMLSSLQS